MDFQNRFRKVVKVQVDVDDLEQCCQATIKYLNGTTQRIEFFWNKDIKTCMIDVVNTDDEKYEEYYYEVYLIIDGEGIGEFVSFNTILYKLGLHKYNPVLDKMFPENDDHRTFTVEEAINQPMNNMIPIQLSLNEVHELELNEYTVG